MEDLSVDREGLVERGDAELRLPRRVRRYRTTPDRLYLLLDPEDEGVASPDLAPPGGARNLVAVGSELSPLWTAGPPPAHPEPPAPYHERLHAVGGPVVTRVSTGGFQATDPETGTPWRRGGPSSTGWVAGW